MTMNTGFGRNEFASLLDNSTLAIPIALAREIGINEAITYQMLVQYHAMKAMVNPHEVFISDDFRAYVAMTVDEIRTAVGFFSDRTIERHIVELQRIGMIQAIRLNQSQGDQTKWYAMLHPAPACFF